MTKFSKISSSDLIEGILSDEKATIAQCKELAIRATCGELTSMASAGMSNSSGLSIYGIDSVGVLVGAWLDSECKYVKYCKFRQYDKDIEDRQAGDDYFNCHGSKWHIDEFLK